jgi:hypothetical protein
VLHAGREIGGNEEIRAALLVHHGEQLLDVSEGFGRAKGGCHAHAFLNVQAIIHCRYHPPGNYID